MWSHEDEGIRKAEVRPCKTIDELVDVIRGGKRRELLGRLAHSASSVSNLATAMGLDDGDISYHLGKLWERGLVEIEQIGATHVYRLSNRIKAAIRGPMIEITSCAANGEQASLLYVLHHLEASRQRIGIHEVRSPS